MKYYILMSSHDHKPVGTQGITGMLPILYRRPEDAEMDLRRTRYRTRDPYILTIRLSPNSASGDCLTDEKECGKLKA